MKDVCSSRHRILIPGKTFLVGEYLALFGGPSIIVNTGPCFEFLWTFEESDEFSVRHPFHKDSPAGRWLNRVRLPDQWQRGKYVIQFHDPYVQRCGLGSSTAEFAGAWYFDRWLARLEKTSDWNFSGSSVLELGDHRDQIVPRWSSERFGSQKFRDILDDYRTVTPSGSGADLISQIAGGLAVWDGRIDEMRKFSWPFSDLAMTLIFTGKKLETHTHLATTSPLDPGVRSEMIEWVEEAVQAFALADADRLTASIRGFGKVLHENGRVAVHTAEFIEELENCSGVRAVKGCGAMGSDILLVLHDQAATFEISEFSQRHGLRIIAKNGDIWQTGLEIHDGAEL